MKSIRLLSLSALLAGSALFATAGQTSQLFRPSDKPAAPPPKTAAPSALACSSCKDEATYATRFVGPANRPQIQRVQIGAKHSCAACGTAVAAQHNCPNEKTTGATCCAAHS